MQTTLKILMVRPINFGLNPETFADNKFQTKGYEEEASQGAIKEFDNFVEILRGNGVEVLVVQDSATPYTPDSLFPNNWFSTHADGTLVLYPMYAPNRRAERKESVIAAIKESGRVERVLDLTHFEEQNKFLEGTGSMIFDRENNFLYACSSLRSNLEVIECFCSEMEYNYLFFTAKDWNGNPIYHTNVMLTVATKYVIVCLDAIENLEERVAFIEMVEASDKEIIEITFDQMANFAGNALELTNNSGESLLILSQRAKESLTDEQIEQIESYSKIVSAPLSIIEKNGGGSARCMIAELFI